MAPSATFSHEQIVAASVRSPTPTAGPSPPVGLEQRASGPAAACRPGSICEERGRRRTASPTSTAASTRAGVVDDELLVDAADRVVPRRACRSPSASRTSPTLATSTPSSLSLVDMSAPVKRSTGVGRRERSPRRGASPPPGPSGSRGPPGRRCRPATTRALADGVDAGSDGAQRVVDDDAAPLADGRARAARARSSRGRMPAENTTRSVGERVASPSKVERRAPVPSLVDATWRGRAAGVDVDAERPRCGAAGARRRRRRAAPASAAGRTRRRGSRGRAARSALAASSPSRPPPITTPPSDVGPLGRGGDRLEVVDGPVDEAPGPVVAGDRRHERARAGGQHQPRRRRARAPEAVVTRVPVAVDRGDRVAQVAARCRVSSKKPGSTRAQVVGGRAVEERGEARPGRRPAGAPRRHGDVHRSGGAALDQLPRGTGGRPCRCRRPPGGGGRRAFGACGTSNRAGLPAVSLLVNPSASGGRADSGRRPCAAPHSGRNRPRGTWRRSHVGEVRPPGAGRIQSLGPGRARLGGQVDGRVDPARGRPAVEAQPGVDAHLDVGGPRRASSAAMAWAACWMRSGSLAITRSWFGV